MDAVLNAAIKVIEQSARNHPADAVLRTQFKQTKLSRAETGRVTELVFAYYRWLGLASADEPIQQRILSTARLDDRYRLDPASFSDTDLMRTLPGWAFDECAIDPAILRAFQTVPSIWLRARNGTGSPLTKRLPGSRLWKPPQRAGPSVRQAISLEDCVEYRGNEDLFRSPEFHAGNFEIQDVASQLVGLLCDPAPGQTWWDACAGEGGKTLHLSDLMGNKGLIWASDRADWRLKRLKQRAGRAKVFNYRAALWDGAAKLPTKTKFDGVLVDAPCSGIGTWQRNPHARWTTTASDVAELADIQKRLLQHAAAAVKPGGRLIYSVCTLARSETDAVADFCSTALAGFEALPLPALPGEPPASSARRWILPQDFGGNGMFVAAWQRQ